MPFRTLLPALLLLSVGCSATHREDEVVSCTPGESLRVACAASEALGECSGDPVLELCDGTQSTCDTRTAIARNDDATAETRCPEVELVCPASGSVLVTSRAFADGDGFACDWAVELDGPVGMDGSVDAGAPDGSMPDGAPPPRDGAPPVPDGAPPRDGSPPPMPDGAPPMDARPPMPDGAPPLDAGGVCELTPSADVRCCYEDADCPGTPGGGAEQCAGGTCETGGQGICVPRPRVSGRCFTDADCAGSETCTDVDLGCSACTDGCPMPTPGNCRPG